MEMPYQTRRVSIRMVILICKMMSQNLNSQAANIRQADPSQKTTLPATMRRRTSQAATWSLPHRPSLVYTIRALLTPKISLYMYTFKPPRLFAEHILPGQFGNREKARLWPVKQSLGQSWGKRGGKQSNDSFLGRQHYQHPRASP